MGRRTKQVLFCNQTWREGGIRELTKQDKKHIEERVKKLKFRIVDEAAEYARLYEKTFYEEVIKMCQERIDLVEDYHERVTSAANS